MEKRVLIFRSGNSARSQMAEVLLRHDAGGRFDAESAGTRPSSVRREAVTAMRELGIDLSGHRSTSVRGIRRAEIRLRNHRVRPRTRVLSGLFSDAKRLQKNILGRSC